MPTDYIRPGNLSRLLAKHLDTRFVLMHTGYPYGEEVIALAKHYRNVCADLCWAWSINPLATMNFVRSYLHAAPINKLFAFGGDTGWPTNSYAYCVQARQWLKRCLQTEIDEGHMMETQSITIADKILRENQLAVFDVQGKRKYLALTVQ